MVAAHFFHVTNAWETTHGSGVTIAVLDTGVNPAQADLSGSVTTGPDYTNSGRTAGGQFWGIHGTEVASLIAGHGHGPGRANGIIGMAPAAKILSVGDAGKQRPVAVQPDHCRRTAECHCPRYQVAVRHDASVIDLPLDPVTTSGAPGSGGSSAERAAINYAIAKKVLLVAPAGDGSAGSDPVNYPAAYHGVIAVGAFDQHFVKAPFTSRQPYVLVTAAGAGVTAASPSGNYPAVNSTSAASAMVAGIVALIRAQFPTLTPAQVTHALTTSTVYHRPGGRADGSGFGTVDAARALTAAAGIAESVSKSATSRRRQPGAPSPPAGHSSPIHRNIRGTLIKDAAIAGVVFLLLLGLIFAITAWRRRNARAARLAEVRAAVQPPVRRPCRGPSPRRGARRRRPPRPVRRAGARAPDAEAAEPQLESAGFIAAPLGPADRRTGGIGFTGSAAGFHRVGPRVHRVHGFTGSGFSGSAAGFTGSVGGFTGGASSGFAAAGPDVARVRRACRARRGAGSARRRTRACSRRPVLRRGSVRTGVSPPGGPVLRQDSGPPRHSAPRQQAIPRGSALRRALARRRGSARRQGSAASLGPAAQDASPAGEATPDLAQPAGAGTGVPPWALISQDPAPGAAARAAASAAIPDGAFLGAPAAPPPARQPAVRNRHPARPGGAGMTRMSSRADPDTASAADAAGIRPAALGARSGTEQRTALGPGFRAVPQRSRLAAQA